MDKKEDKRLRAAKWYKENKEYVKQRGKAKYAANLEENRKKSREAAIKFRRDNPEARQKILERYREKNRERINKNNSEWCKTHKEQNYATKKRWVLANPEKVAARNVIRKLLKRKKNNITKPKNCMVCGKETVVHGHHPDYSRPTEVIWCCGTCHKKLHMLLN